MHDPNFKYMSEGKGAAITACFGKDGITIRDPNREGKGAGALCQQICERST